MFRPVHFEVKADDPSRARTFYEGVFEWSFEKWDGPTEYWSITTGDKDEPGIGGGMSKRDTPTMPHILTIDVPDVDEYTALVQKYGGTVIMPKMPIPGVGYFAYVEDTEGNRFGILASDPAAS